MFQGYQRQDAEFLDYELYELPGVHGTFRGPAMTGSGYIACVGAAQTFGRFVEIPYPRLLSTALGMPVLNLGRGGAGPTFPLSSPALLDYIHGARLVIVQVFSGRSQSNSLFRTVNHGMSGTNLATGQAATADEFYTWLLTEQPQRAEEIVAETRENYLAAMHKLLGKIARPKILFWFSVRSPEYQERCAMPLPALWGEFPHFVNQSMMDHLRGDCDAYVECVSRRGLPQPLTRRRASSSPSGEPGGRTHNHYYPSPEMHQEGAERLAPVCRQLLGDGLTQSPG